ncbi:unnamed protein product [Periconia digitata]|uniref:Uncharacterized protein n=1 Tax=Periconia digitata TaxID=1303443 RepID=A0A9W4XGZ2_9PLEO|nr:unnamed protein product [Periconia digitata]
MAFLHVVMCLCANMTPRSILGKICHIPTSMYLGKYLKSRSASRSDLGDLRGMCTCMCMHACLRGVSTYLYLYIPMYVCMGVLYKEISVLPTYPLSPPKTTMLLPTSLLLLFLATSTLASPLEAAPSATASAIEKGHKNKHHEHLPRFKKACECVKPVMPMGMLSEKEKCHFRYYQDITCFQVSGGGCKEPVLKVCSIPSFLCW